MDESKVERKIEGPGNAIQEVEKEIKKALTILWHDLEGWQQDNQFITSGYRSTSNSYWKSFTSLGYWHNETVNIFSHLLGAFCAVAIGSWLLTEIKPRYAKATTVDIQVFSCFFLGCVLCLGMSATFHTISNHSEPVARSANKLDYVGIILLIWGSFIPSIYYGFNSEPALIRTYWSMITTIAAGTLTVVLLRRFGSSKWRPFRAFMFVAMGLSAVVPVIHGLKVFGWEQMQSQIGLSWLVLQGLLYIVGAFIYAARIPERWRPGTFDIIGSSHQIFHIFVLLAAASHLTGLLQAFDNNHRLRR